MFVSFLAATARGEAMTRQTHRILIGSLGWQHDAWQGDYYPEDLPPEWRLGYYSNEFPLLVITEQERTAQAELAEEMASCREDLQVLIMVAPAAADPAPTLAAALALLRQLPRDGGLLLQVNPATISDPDAWLGQVQAQLAQVPVCVDPVARLNDAWREALSRRGIGWSWNAHSDSEGLKVGPLAVIRLDGTVSPQQLRERIEAGLAASDETRKVALLFAGTPPQLVAMRQAKTIEELM